MAVVTKRKSKPATPPPSSPDGANKLDGFSSEIVDSVRSNGNVWELPEGCILLPRVFGFCRGVKHALVMLDEAGCSCWARSSTTRG